MKKMKLIFTAFAAMFILSCTSTQVISSYKDEKTAAIDYKKILIFGIFPQKERGLRQETENHLASRLKDLGYNALTAMDEYGPKAFEKIEEAKLTEMVKSGGYDAIITTALLDTKDDKVYQQGTVRYQPVGETYDRFGRYSSTIYSRVYEPGYYTTSTNYVLETNLYTVSSGRLVYSVQTKAYNPSSAGSLANDNSKQIVKDLREKGVLIKK